MTVCRPCLQCGTPTERTRCTWCESARQRERNTARGDRYDADHRATRKRWAEAIAEVGGCACGRNCGRPILHGQDWHLDHLDDGTYWPSHAHCNESSRRNA